MGLTASFGIGEFARRCERSVHTIRWYEAQGLMPRVDRDRGGRRLYTPWHVDWLMFLGRLRTTGMSIRDMKRYTNLIALGEAGVAAQEILLRSHREIVDAHLKETHAALALIDRKLGHYRGLLGAKRVGKHRGAPEKA